MRISNAGGPGRATASSRARPSSGSGAVFQPDDVKQSRQTAAPRAAQAIHGVDALLAIQEVGDALSGARRAVRRGHALLDTLEELRLDLLAGGIDAGKLQRLLRLVEQRDGQAASPTVQRVLDEIELRARVELAKHERLPRPAG